MSDTNKYNKMKPFTYQELTYLVAALHKRGIKIGKTDYEVMAALDPTKTASAYDHIFRPAKSQAAELIKKLPDAPAATPQKRAAKDTSTQGSNKKKKVKVDDDASVKPELSDDESKDLDFF